MAVPTGEVDAVYASHCTSRSRIRHHNGTGSETEGSKPAMAASRARRCAAVHRGFRVRELVIGLGDLQARGLQGVHRCGELGGVGRVERPLQRLVSCDFAGMTSADRRVQTACRTRWRLTPDGLFDGESGLSGLHTAKLAAGHVRVGAPSAPRVAVATDGADDHRDGTADDWSGVSHALEVSGGQDGGRLGGLWLLATEHGCESFRLW